MEYNDILFEVVDREIARITLNRPERMNSLRPRMREEILDAVNRVAKDNLIRVLIIAGNGRAWCTGGDLTKTAEEGMHPPGHGMIQDMVEEQGANDIDIDEPLRMLRVPTIAQVNGYVMAAGWTLMNVLDFVIAAEGAKIGIWAGKFGDGAADHKFSWMFGIPRRMARQIVYTSDLFDAEELYRMGLINKVVPLEKLEEETLVFAKNLTNINPMHLRMTKESMRAMDEIAGYYAAEQTAELYHVISEYPTAPFAGEIQQKRLKLGMHWLAEATKAGAFRDIETRNKVIEESLKELEKQGGKFSDLESLRKTIKDTIESVRNDKNWKGPKIR